jgi:hypothetical protein
VTCAFRPHVAQSLRAGTPVAVTIRCGARRLRTRSVCHGFGSGSGFGGCRGVPGRNDGGPDGGGRLGGDPGGKGGRSDARGRAAATKAIGLSLHQPSARQALKVRQVALNRTPWLEKAVRPAWENAIGDKGLDRLQFVDSDPFGQFRPPCRPSCHRRA